MPKRLRMLLCLLTATAILGSALPGQQTGGGAGHLVRQSPDHAATLCRMLQNWSAYIGKTCSNTVISAAVIYGIFKIRGRFLLRRARGRSHFRHTAGACCLLYDPDSDFPYAGHAW